MLISIEVQDDKSKLFIEFLKNLDFVKVKKSEFGSVGHVNMLNERIEEYHSNSKQIDVRKALEELKLKYGF